MHPTSRFLCVLSLIFLTVVSIQAQPTGQNSTPPLEVTMILQQQQVRFAAPSSVQELRLEVFDRAGELIHDSGVVSGAELIWPLRKADGQPVTSGLYAYQLTLKEASAESPRTQRGHLIVERGQDRDPQVDRVWITSQSPGGVGASITDAELTVAASKETTVAGARISDGRADGSGKGVAALAPNAPTAVVNGAGTPGRIAKWTASDTIGNSIITETGGGNLGIGTTTPGSKLTVAGAIDTSTQYNIDGTRILANPGTNNLFAGAGAGAANTTGNGNAFIGRNAGNSNTTGDWNSALGTAAGRNNTTGAGNTFVGFQTGLSNTTQNNNTFIGYQANGAAGITNAAAIGANASVTQSNSLVLGSNSVNIGIGVTAPSQKLHVAGQIYSSAGGFRFPDGTVQTSAATGGGGGGVTSVTASGPLASSGGATPNVSLTGVVPIANGGTGSSTQNFVDLAMPQTIGGAKSFTSNIIGNITGNAATVTNGVYTTGDQSIGGNKNFTSAIGIRASSPRGPLDIVHNGENYAIHLESPSNGYAEIDFRNGPGNGDVNRGGWFNYQFYSNKFAWGTKNAAGIEGERMVLDREGNLGIGVAAASQKLHVAGQIYSSSGGFRFPDGTVQTTAAAGGGGGVASVTASGPLASSGGTTPNISLTGVIPVANGGTGSAIQNFVDLATVQTIGGTKTFTSAVNTNSQYNIGGNRILANPGTDNLFNGVGTGVANTTGNSNSFFGANAGAQNTTGCCNAFFGTRAGIGNITGEGNSFFGSGAGQVNTTGCCNSFFGGFAGLLNTGSSNSFFGHEVGQGNTTGFSNSFFGKATGENNTAGYQNAFFGAGAGYNNTTASDNAFFGTGAGQFNTAGGSNAFIGGFAGLSNTTESNNTFIGYQANGATGITNATAIGANASVTQSNSLVLGATNVSVGIGVTAPAAKLDIRSGDVYLGSAGQGVILKSPDGATCRKLTIDNAGALVLTAIACP